MKQRDGSFVSLIEKEPSHNRSLILVMIINKAEYDTHHIQLALSLDNSSKRII